jgi:hypothetical protein
LQIESLEVLPFQFVTLDKFSLDTLKFFEDNVHNVVFSVKELLKSQKRAVKPEAAAEVVMGDDND